MLTNDQIFADERIFLETVLKFALNKMGVTEMNFSLADLREASGFQFDIVNVDEVEDKSHKVAKIILSGVHSVSELSEEDKLDRAYGA